ncbi:hypothetical protein PHLGIDRAFT_19123 [Phlebiopsis gigantea 11061_1 CR5-6]|uniref:Uncharacterized protein n=1 Tax=Phlebiopsis gigantea (strain 11061_1 CR5-6) TaxID=745531 RepID=A0A0C3PM87_PHLG1|nr:hypothetical protein PHLGIDRAFT_19123 [Phlebiopsis gigantea 11061_1 CR5-6]
MLISERLLLSLLLQLRRYGILRPQHTTIRLLADPRDCLLLLQRTSSFMHAPNMSMSGANTKPFLLHTPRHHPPGRQDCRSCTRPSSLR